MESPLSSDCPVLVVMAEDGIAFLCQKAGGCRIAPAVLSQSMNYKDNRPGLSPGQPALIIKFEATPPFEIVVYLLHMVIFIAGICHFSPAGSCSQGF
jgi:hypothetical protein